MPDISLALLKEIFEKLKSNLTPVDASNAEFTPVTGANIFAAEIFSAIGGSERLSNANDEFLTKNAQIIAGEEFSVNNDAASLIRAAEKYYQDNLNLPRLRGVKPSLQSIIENQNLSAFIKELTNQPEVSETSLNTWKQLITSTQDIKASLSIQQTVRILDAAIAKLNILINNEQFELRSNEINAGRRGMDSGDARPSSPSPTITTGANVSKLKNLYESKNSASEQDEMRRKAEQERLKREQEEEEKEKAKQERLKKEQEEKEKAEQERLKKEQEEKAEQERLKKEQEEKEKAEQERLKKEQEEKAEQESLKKEQEEKEKAEQERLKKEQEEKAEQERLKKEQEEKEKAEQERLKKEQEEKDKAEQERLKKEQEEKAEQERLKKEQEDKDKDNDKEKEKNEEDKDEDKNNEKEKNDENDKDQKKPESKSAEDLAAEAAARQAQAAADAQAKRQSDPEMKQQEVLGSVSSSPVKITNFAKLEELVEISKQVNDTKQLKQAADLLYRFGLKNIESGDANQQNLNTRAQLLKEWNTVLLPLQSQLIDRVATLKVLQAALKDAKNTLLNSPHPTDPDITPSVWRKSIKEQDELIAHTEQSLDTYSRILDKVNQIETGLAQTSTTRNYDPDYSNQILVEASAIVKTENLSSDGKEKALKDLREQLGMVVENRKQAAELELCSQAHVDQELARAKIDTTKHYTVVGILGKDVNGMNGPEQVSLNLNTIYTLAASPENRRDLSLKIVDFREDLNVAKTLAKFAVDKKFFHNPQTNSGPSFDDLRGLFSGLPTQLPTQKEIKALLEPHVGGQSGALAGQMHSELKRVMRSEQNSDVPNAEALRIAKHAVDSYLNAMGDANHKTDQSQIPDRIVIRGTNAEAKRAIKYYCELMKQLAKTPEEAKKYDYIDPSDNSKPEIKRGMWDKMVGNWGNKNKEENKVVAGLNKDMRRVAKTLLREEYTVDAAVPLKANVDPHVPLKQSFAVGLAVKALGANDKKHNLEKLTSEMQQTNSTAARSVTLKDAIAAEKTNMRSASRLPAAYTDEAMLPPPRGPAPAG